MKRNISIILVFTALTLLLGSFLYFYKGADSKRSEGNKKLLANTIQKKSSSLEAEHRNTDIESTVESANKSDWSKTAIYQFYESHDLYSLANEMLPKAKRGEPEAQYLLYKVSQVCYPELIEGFKKEIDSDISIITGVYQELTIRCNNFNEQTRKAFEHPKGKLGWLKESFDKGYPVAVVDTLLLAKNASNSDGDNERMVDELIQSVDKLNSEQKSQLIIEVIQSNNPYALTGVAALVKQPRTAWRLAACDLGAQCYPITLSERIGWAASCSIRVRTGKECLPSNSSLKDLYKRNYRKAKWNKIDESRKQILSLLNKNKLDESELKVLLTY
ncbi:hypothetical protein [Kangiella shandongensis]|uniref:hypothetical protein n=1 Tax=Kangiella shandongensis TaxID=2763258 RepID=UPI001CBD2D6D|nr:hypothetical protein [Kangiella shandongensis]